MKALRSKLPNAGTTIFTVMTALAEQHGAINLAQGFPDFQPPRRLQDLLQMHVQAGRNQYAPMAGVRALREAIAEKVRMLYGADRDPELEITITAGATEALFCAVQAVVGPGDEVVVLDPAYDSYEPAVALAGGRTIHVPLAAPDFAVDWDRLEAAMSPHVRLVIVNSPHNPAGALLDAADLSRLADLTRRRDCFVLSDEVYEHVVFEGSGHASVLARAELAQRAFAVFSFGKTYHATGWKIGYCVAPPALTAEFRRIHQYVTFAAATPMQCAIADYLLEAPEHYLELPDFYRRKRDYFASLLAGSRFDLLPSHGTYFQLADYGRIADVEDGEFARRLTVDHGVAAIPVSVFYERPRGDPLVRFCFAKEEATLEAAAARLRAV